MIDAALLALYRCIAGTGLPCMIGGSVGAMMFGELRATMDIDVIVDARPVDAERLIAALNVADYYVPALDVVRHALARGDKGSFNIIDPNSGLKLDCYPAGDDELIRWGLAHRRTVTVGDASVLVAPPEYLIVMKLRYFSLSGQEKHIRDIAALLAHIPVDRAIVSAWAERYGVGQSFTRCCDAVARNASGHKLSP